MVKLIQTKCIKQALMLLTIVMTLSYQQVSYSTEAIDNVRGKLVEVLNDPNQRGWINVNSPVQPASNGDLVGAINSDSVSNFINSVNAAGALRTEVNFYGDSNEVQPYYNAAALARVDTMVILVELVDTMVELASMDLDVNLLNTDPGGAPQEGGGIERIFTGTVLLSAYNEIFNELVIFLEIFAIRGGHSLRLNDKTFRVDGCDSLFCSIYTLRRENQSQSIVDFSIEQLVGNPEVITLNDYLPVQRSWYDSLRSLNEAINSLRQSRAATQTVLPGNDPNAGQQQQQQQPVISEECQMAPSMPGC